MLVCTAALTCPPPVPLSAPTLPATAASPLPPLPARHQPQLATGRLLPPALQPLLASALPGQPSPQSLPARLSHLQASRAFFASSASAPSCLITPSAILPPFPRHNSRISASSRAFSTNSASASFSVMTTSLPHDDGRVNSYTNTTTLERDYMELEGLELERQGWLERLKQLPQRDQVEAS